MLCASAYGANDFNLFKLYKNKIYKWGYFLETNKYDIDQLLDKKEKKTKLETIKEIGVIIVGYDIPYEFRFSKNAEIPFRIYSFISPVVYNIANKFKNIPELYSVNFPIKDILKRKSVYQQILITYSKHPLIKTLNIY